MPEVTCSGEPDTGNPHVRFDEGRGTSVPSYSTGSVVPERCVEKNLCIRGSHLGAIQALTLSSSIFLASRTLVTTCSAADRNKDRTEVQAPSMRIATITKENPIVNTTDPETKWLATA